MKKHNRRMKNTAIARADKRAQGAAKILNFLSRGADVKTGAYGLHCLQQKYGI